MLVFLVEMVFNYLNSLVFVKTSLDSLYQLLKLVRALNVKDFIVRLSSKKFENLVRFFFVNILHSLITFTMTSLDYLLQALILKLLLLSQLLLQICFKSFQLFYKPVAFIITHTVSNLTIYNLLLLLNLPALNIIFNINLIQECLYSHIVNIGDFFHSCL
jgi:hypothetical protein